MAVPSWEAFLRLRDALQAAGLRADGPLHRLWLGEQRVDLIPFGRLERADRSIGWPPDEDVVMNVIGLAEAMDTAVAVRFPGDLVFDVASLPALALLKIWAWIDRRHTSPDKDASDLWQLLRNYAQAGNEERLYSSEGEALAAVRVRLGAGRCLAARQRRARGGRSRPGPTARSTTSTRC